MIDQTKTTYENPNFVQMYVDVNKDKDWEIKKAQDFARSFEPRSKILDLGCGPGHLTYVIAKIISNDGTPLNHIVTGSDYSQQMISAAEKLEEHDNRINFEVRDMTQLAMDYPDDTFNGIFANASLLHLSPDNVQKVLEGIKKVTRNGGKVYISLKKGEPQTSKVTERRQYAGEEKEFTRQFTYWQGDDFAELAKKFGLKLDKLVVQTGSATSGKATEWLNYYFILEK